ncbi:MAG: hypothetical protein NUW22_06875 [Acidobacteria bacterium]|nr:hypothetical protein [Acidobacteriota bacterium]
MKPFLALRLRTTSWLGVAIGISLLMPGAADRSEASLLVVGQYPPWGGNWCGLELKATTAERRVYGTGITAECGGCVGNTAPHGNWGVDSFYSNRSDGSHYKGWATSNPNCPESIDDPEWNSCTRDYTSSVYYNGDPPLQYSPNETDLGMVWDWYSTTEEEGCSILDGVQIYGGTVLEIWELDHWGPWDDHVTDLQVSSGSALLGCDRWGCAPVATAWGGGSNGVTSTDFRITLMSSCAWVDGKGCI